MKDLLKKTVVYILTLEARAVLRRARPHIIAVTGNVGKTSTKDAVYAVLSRAYDPLGIGAVRKSQKSLNSEFGVPLTILGLETAWSSAGGWMRNIWKGARIALMNDRYPAWLVLEVGADHPGDIESVAKWLRPDIVVLTRMSDIPVHVEFFADADAVLREKMFLAKAIKPGGALVVNADDPHFKEPVAALIRERASAEGGPLRVFGYGASKGSIVEILESEVAYDRSASPLPLGQYAIMRMAGQDDRGEASATEVRIDLAGALGDHLMYPLAAACATGIALEIPLLKQVVESAFRRFKSPNGRMRVLRGKNSSAIVDDSYNSSPLACAEALKTVGRLSVRGRKIAALGDMKELGSRSETAHREIGALAADALHTLVTVGDMARYMAAGALESGMTEDRILHFDTSEEAAAALSEFVRAGDVILVKGSQSMRMERVTKALLADPESAHDVLVRQEREWEKR